jgi:integrase/recombinase XerD
MARSSKRGRKIIVGKDHATLFVRHTKDCPKRTDNSGTVECKCVRSVKFTDGSQLSTHQWSWAKAEEVARRMLADRAGVDPTTIKPAGYPVERAIDEWIAEREADGVRYNAKAKLIGRKLLDWCKKNNIEHLSQITKQALRVWRTTGWKYRTGDSTSTKVHWSMLRSFFSWCVEGDLLEGNPCPKFKGKIKPQQVVPLTPQQMDALEAAVAKMQSPGWTDERRLRMRALILVMRWSGMAINDAVCLERSSGGITRLIGPVIHGQRHKTSKKFSVPLPGWLVDLLKALPVAHPKYYFWHKRPDGREVLRTSMVTQFGDWFGEMFKLAGIKGHSHQFRHSFATYHLSRGVSVERVAEWMGDSVAEVLRTYGHWIPARQELSEQAMRDSWAKMGLDAAGNPVSTAVQ